MTFDEVTSEASDLEAKILNNLLAITDPTQLGLDRRVGRLYVDRDFTLIATQKNNTLAYYGGFEYVDEDYIVQVGSLTVYSGEAERVRNALNILAGVKGPQSPDDDESDD